MSKWCIDICRTQYKTTLFEVEADSEEEAKELAMQQAHDYEWYDQDGVDYEITGIVKDTY